MLTVPEGVDLRTDIVERGPAAMRPGEAGGSSASDWVDAHVHVWDPGVRAQPWMNGDRFSPIRRRFDLDDLSAATAGTPVARAVLIQNLATAAESRDFLALAGVDAGRRPRTAGVVGWVDLRAPDVAEQVVALQEAPGGQLLVGIRHPVQDEPDPDWLARPDVLRGLGVLAAAGLSFDVLAGPGQLVGAVRAVRAVPECRFVVDHLGRPPIPAGLASSAGRSWLAAVIALAAEPNVAMKVSGLVTEAAQPWTVAAIRPWVRAAVDAFGPTRLMFASDWPVCLLAATYPDVSSAARDLTGQLVGADLEAFVGGTAGRWYRLPAS